MKKEQLDSLHIEAIQFILDALAKEEILWQRPWDDLSVANLPRDAINNKVYRESNLYYLWMAQQANGYKDPRWLTLKQVSENGWKVKEGSEGTPIFFWGCYDKATNQEMTGSLINELRAQGLSGNEIKERKKFVQRYWRLFNGEQIDGIDEFEREKALQVPFSNQLAKEYLEATIKGMKVGLTESKTGEAYYLPQEDTVHIPDRDYFYSESEYYAAVFHELIHATGASSRLSRKGITKDSVDIKEEAYEELVAELGAALIGVDTGLFWEIKENHAAYCRNWFQKNRETPTLVFDALKDAVEAVEYIHKISDFEKIKERRQSEVIALGQGNNLVSLYEAEVPIISTKQKNKYTNQKSFRAAHNDLLEERKQRGGFVSFEIPVYAARASGDKSIKISYKDETYFWVPNSWIQTANNKTWLSMPEDYSLEIFNTRRNVAQNTWQNDVVYLVDTNAIQGYFTKIKERGREVQNIIYRNVINPKKEYNIDNTVVYGKTVAKQLEKLNDYSVYEITTQSLKIKDSNRLDEYVVTNAYLRTRDKANREDEGYTRK